MFRAQTIRRRLPFVGAIVAASLATRVAGADEPRILVRIGNDLVKRHGTAAQSLGRPLPGGWYELAGEVGAAMEFAGGVDAVERDYLRRAAEAFPVVPVVSPHGHSLRDRQYALDRVRAEQAWALQRGKRSVVVAVIDSGVDLNHPSLAGNLWRNPRETLNGLDDNGNGYVDDVHGWDFVGQDADPSDASGHGTHIAGVIAAGQGGEIAGLANVSIMVLRVLDTHNEGFDSRTMAAIGYAIDEGADVINLSLGGVDDSRALRDACAAAVGAGVVVVAAAGNQSGAVIYPAAYDSVIAVGASDEDDEIASFSNRGRSLDLVAPGVNIISTARGGGFEFRSGTSVAAPMVSAAAALLRSADSRLSVASIRARLTLAADDVAAVGWDELSGYGRLNLFAALDAGSTPPDDAAEAGADAGEIPDRDPAGENAAPPAVDDALPPWIRLSPPASRPAAQEQDRSDELQVFAATTPLMPAPCGAGLSAATLGLVPLLLVRGRAGVGARR